ncbi:MAG: sugar transferase, partial [Flavobacteriales bacterium]
TVGDRDPRITKVGLLLRKSKMDELPQLINILKGEMSWVGPRPEVPKYVSLYSEDQRRVLSVRPGLTDIASIEYIEESQMLAKSQNPSEILPKKLELQLKYIENQSFTLDVSLIWKTFTKILQTLSK